MDMINVLSIIATVLSVGGNALLAFKKKITFPIWIVSNVIWIYIIVKSSMNIPQLSMYAIYTGMSIMSWINWTKTERRQKGMNV